MPNKKQILLRLDPETHDALKRWADDELRSVNAQIGMFYGSRSEALVDCRSQEKGLGETLRFGCSLAADTAQNEMC